MVVVGATVVGGGNVVVVGAVVAAVVEATVSTTSTSVGIETSVDPHAPATRTRTASVAATGRIR